MNKRDRIKAALLETTRRSLDDGDARAIVAAKGLPVKTAIRAGEPYVKIEFVKRIKQ